MVFHAQPEVIAASGATEMALAQGMVASAAAKAPMLVGVLPMGADPASAQFAIAMNMAGGALLAAHNLHAVSRDDFAVKQQVSGATIDATETIRAAITAFSL